MARRPLGRCATTEAIAMAAVTDPEILRQLNAGEPPAQPPPTPPPPDTSGAPVSREPPAQTFPPPNALVVDPSLTYAQSAARNVNAAAGETLQQGAIGFGESLSHMESWVPDWMKTQAQQDAARQFGKTLANAPDPSGTFGKIGRAGGHLGPYVMIPELGPVGDIAVGSVVGGTYGREKSEGFNWPGAGAGAVLGGLSSGLSALAGKRASGILAAMPRDTQDFNAAWMRYSLDAIGQADKAPTTAGAIEINQTRRLIGDELANAKQGITLDFNKAMPDMIKIKSSYLANLHDPKEQQQLANIFDSVVQDPVSPLTGIPGVRHQPLALSNEELADRLTKIGKAAASYRERGRGLGGSPLDREIGRALQDAKNALEQAITGPGAAKRAAANTAYNRIEVLSDAADPKKGSIADPEGVIGAIEDRKGRHGWQSSFANDKALGWLERARQTLSQPTGWQKAKRGIQHGAGHAISATAAGAFVKETGLPWETFWPMYMGLQESGLGNIVAQAAGGTVGRGGRIVGTTRPAVLGAAGSQIGPPIAEQISPMLPTPKENPNGQ